MMSMQKEKLPTTAIQLPKTHIGPVYCAKFNNQGEYCMTGSEDRSVCLYNPSKTLMIKQYKNVHNYDVYSIDINKDNSKFISGGGDKNIILTDVLTAKYIRKYTGHTSRVNSVAFSPDNQVIVLSPRFRSALPTTLRSDAGTIATTAIIQSKSLKASKIQSPRLLYTGLRSSVRAWTVP